MGRTICALIFFREDSECVVLMIFRITQGKNSPKASGISTNVGLSVHPIPKVTGGQFPEKKQASVGGPSM